MASPQPSPKTKILIVENDLDNRRLYRKILRRHFRMRTTTSPRGKSAIRENGIAAVVANCRTRQGEQVTMEGFSLLRYARAQGHFLPFIFLADAMDDDLLAEADHHGAFEVIHKGQADFSAKLIKCLQAAAEFCEYQKQRHHRPTSLSQALCQIPHMSPINWDSRDEGLYEAFFEIDSRSNKYCYANSWLYICQAARRNGHKFFDGKTLITIEAAIKDDGSYQFTIIRPVGQQAAKKAFELATALKALTPHPIIFARLEPEQFKNLQQRGCQILSNPGTGNLEDYFDDIHPQVVVDLNKFVFNLNLPEMAWFRRGLRQFNKKNYTVQDLQPSQYQEIRNILARWKRSFVGRYERKSDFKTIPFNNDYYFDPYLPFVEHFGHASQRNQNIATIFYVDQTPVGFSFLASVSDCCMAMYANIGDTYFDGLAKFMLYQNFLRAFWAGYTHINLGGTEAQSLYEFYHKLTGRAVNEERAEFSEFCFLRWNNLSVHEFTKALQQLETGIRRRKAKMNPIVSAEEIEGELFNLRFINLFETILAQQRENFSFYHSPLSKTLILDRKYLTL